MLRQTGAIRISVVVPLLNEAESLPELHRRLITVLEGMGEPFELIFVDDGSTDATAEILARLAASDPHVRGIRLARNVGQHHALMAGFRHARGERVVTIDADLQSLPEDIPRLLARLDEGFDIVFGSFRSRKHPPLTRLTSALAQLLMRYELDLPPGVRFSPFRAMDRRLVDRLVSFTGTPVQLETLINRCTNSMAAVEVDHAPRIAGETKYHLRRRLSFGLTFVTRASLLPLRLATALGTMAAVLGVGLCAAAALKAFPDAAGTALVLGAVCMLGGAILAAVGVLGEYVAQIQRSVSQEPQYVVRECFGSADTDETRTPAQTRRARAGGSS